MKLHITLLLMTGLFAAAPLFGQDEGMRPPPSRTKGAEGEDTVKKVRIEILNTDVFEFTTTDSNQVRRFDGSVRFRHEGTDFACDRAVQYMDTEIMVATGNVHIQKPDSFDIWSDHLVYYSRLKQAEFRGNVVFRDSTAELTTDSLDYDLNSDVGNFWGGGVLVNDSSVLRSVSGTYYHRKREAVFRDSVHLEHPDFDLYADSMRYDTRERVAWFIAPTRIVNEGDVITANSGYFDTKTGRAHFGGKAEMVSGETRILADAIDYDQERGYGKATGNVVWEDTVEQITIVSNFAEYLDSLDYVLATGDPLLIDVDSTDTMYLSADTLITFKVPRPAGKVSGFPDPLFPDSVIKDSAAIDTALTDTAGIRSDTLVRETVEVATDSLVMSDSTELQPADSVRIFYAFRNARILRGRLSGLCDSLRYSTADSVFRMLRDPIMWVDTTQFTGDSIHLALEDGEIDRVLIYRNALIISESDPDVYNQTRGKFITGYFKGQRLDRMEIDGNGESIFFIQDDSSAYVGGNKTLCSRMTIFMKDTADAVSHILFLTEPEAVFTPFHQIDRNSYRLGGFRWEFERKPHTKFDVIRYLPLYEYYLERRRPDAVAETEAMPPPPGPADEEEAVQPAVRPEIQTGE